MQPLTLLIAALAATVAATADAGLYRWVDENGNVTYSDQVPPDRADGGHAELNRRGIQVREVGPARSAEEVAREKAREAQLRAEQQRIEQQREADRILLKSFPTEDEVLMARDGKLATFDLNIDVLSGNARRIKQHLLDIQEQVTARQRIGKAVGASFRAEMASLQQQLVSTYRRMLDEEEKMQTIRDEYAGYLQRYRELKGLPQTVRTVGEDDSAERPDPVTAVACTGKPECSARWERAVSYLTRATGTPVAMTTESLVITGRPERDRDISLTLALVPDSAPDRNWILLELQCNATPVGAETCETATADSVRRGFRGAVTGDGPRAARTEPARTPPRPVPAG
jgi:hypothetical protein